MHVAHVVVDGKRAINGCPRGGRRHCCQVLGKVGGAGQRQKGPVQTEQANLVREGLATPPRMDAVDRQRRPKPVPYTGLLELEVVEP